jgi:hypothetical protein
MEEYILNIKNYYPNKLLKLPILTKEQIKSLENPYRIYFYCFYNYIDKLKKYYLWSKDINKLYIIAANRGYIKILKYLESLGYYINLESAYLYAAQGNQLKVLDYLKSKNVNIYYTNGGFFNALMYAPGNIKTIKYLLNEGLSMYMINDSLFIQAYYCGTVKIIKYLIKIGDFNKDIKELCYNNFINPVTEYLFKYNRYKSYNNKLIFIFGP